MEALLKNMSPDVRQGAKYYIASKDISQLFECVTTGLLHHRPENPVIFVQEALAAAKEQPPGAPIPWDTFINWKPSREAMSPPSNDGTRRLPQSAPSRNSSRTASAAAGMVNGGAIHSRDQVTVPEQNNVNDTTNRNTSVETFP